MRESLEQFLFTDNLRPSRRNSLFRSWKSQRNH